MKWLYGKDSIYQIGGRSTDISQIAYSLELRVKESYPMNSVPSYVVIKLEELTRELELGEKLIQEFIDINEKAFQNKLDRCLVCGSKLNK